MTTPATHKQFRAGLVQMCSGRHIEANVIAATTLVREAVALGAQYVQTPEVTTIMELDRKRLFSECRSEDDDTSLAHFRALARELAIWLHIGSIAIKISDEKLANRSFVISPQGRIVARYDKIHMFDVDLPGGESYKESRNYTPGADAVVVELPWCNLGLTICYDLRFPGLHRALAQAGAHVIAIPAAFTKTTGEAHWHTLIRARAIETQCFVLAAAQGGHHEHGRDTYGHSLIVSPWGEVLAEGGTEPGVILADIDLGVLADVRQRVPSLRHDRPFAVATVSSAGKATT